MAFPTGPHGVVRVCLSDVLADGWTRFSRMYIEFGVLDHGKYKVWWSLVPGILVIIAYRAVLGGALQRVMFAAMKRLLICSWRLML